MGIEIRKRVARREIDVVIHSGDFVPGHQLAWCPRVRGNCGRSREGGRLRRRRQREYTLHRRRFAAPRGPAGRRALSRSRCRVRGIVVRSAALLLSAQRQSQKRAHRQCCTPITHLIPPELYPANPVWFTRPPADRSLLLAGPVGRIAALELVAPTSAGTTSPHTPVRPREKSEEAKGRGAVRLFHNSLSVQLLPSTPGRLLGRMVSAVARSHESQSTAHASRRSLALLSTAHCQLSDPALHFSSYELDRHTRQPLDWTAAFHCCRATRVRRPPRRGRPRAWFHARHLAPTASGPWHRRALSRRHASDAHPPGPRRRYRLPRPRKSTACSLRTQERRAPHD